MPKSVSNAFLVYRVGLHLLACHTVAQAEVLRGVKEDVSLNYVVRRGSEE